MKKIRKYEELKQELIKLEEKMFILEMQDHWDSEDYKTSDELNEKIKKIKEEFKLTPSEKNTLIVIEEFIKENEYPPSVRKLCDELGYTSTATVFSKLTELRAKGYIDYKNGKNRTIKILKKGDE